MDKKFLMVKTYKSLLNKPFIWGKIIFTTSMTIHIVIFNSGGGYGFTPIVSYEIILNDGKTSNQYNETSGVDGAPLYSFIKSNDGVLFELTN